MEAACLTDGKSDLAMYSSCGMADLACQESRHEYGHIQQLYCTPD